MGYNDFREYGEAERAMRSYAEAMRSERVEVRLHEPIKARGWQHAVAALTMVLLIVGVGWLSRPQVYGYVNGEPIYSLSEAEAQAEQIMANLAQADVAQENLLQGLFIIE